MTDDERTFVGPDVHPEEVAEGFARLADAAGVPGRAPPPAPPDLADDIVPALGMEDQEIAAKLRLAAETAKQRSLVVNSGLMALLFLAARRIDTLRDNLEDYEAVKNRYVKLVTAHKALREENPKP